MPDTALSRIVVGGATLSEAETIRRMVAGRTWLEDQTVQMALVFGGGWTMTVKLDDELVGVVLAMPGSIPVVPEPDPDADENFTETGYWIDDVDPGAELFLASTEPPSSDDRINTLALWDVVMAKGREDLLDDVLNAVVSAVVKHEAVDSITWLDNQSTRAMTEALCNNMVFSWGGAMGCGNGETGLGDVCFWVNVGL